MASKYYIPVENHGRVGDALHRQVALDERVTERAADVALHHPAEAVVARAERDAHVVDLVLEGLERVAAVNRVAEHGLELAAIGAAACIRGNAGKLVVG